jgi:hypothetical protein
MSSQSKATLLHKVSGIGRFRLPLKFLHFCLCAGLHVERAVMIGIGGRIAPPPLPHHRTYGSRIRRFRDLSR